MSGLRLLLTVALLSACASACRRSSAPGPIHYCSCAPGAAAGCVAGDDKAAGGAKAPRRSLADLERRFATARPGAVFKLCRGGAWHGAATLALSAKAEAPVVLEAYGEGADPLLRAPPGENGLTLECGGGGDDHCGPLRVEGLRLQGQGGDSAGVFKEQPVDELVLRSLDISGFRIGVQSGRGRTMVVERCFIHDNSAIGALAGHDGLQLVDSRYDNNGFAMGFLGHNIYITGGRDVVVRGNVLTRSALDDKGACMGISINAHGGLTRNLRIEDNVLVEDVAKSSCWGIAADVHSDGAQGHIGAKIVGNRLRGVGRVAITVAGCEQCEVRGNTVEVTTTFPNTMILAPRPTEKPPRPTRDLVITENRFVSRGGGGVCFEVQPETLAASDENVCEGLDWAPEQTLEAWRETVKADLQSRHTATSTTPRLPPPPAPEEE